MKRWLLIAWQQSMRRAGYPGLLAVALLVATCVAMAWAPRVGRQTEALRARLGELTSTPSRQIQLARRKTAGEQAAEFMSRFPPLTQSSSDLGELFLIAQRRNVTLPKGEYQLKAEPNASLTTYSATFAVRNEYAALKAFTADVLEAMPHVSLDELRMSRADAGSGALDSVVRLTFVYRSP